MKLALENQNKKKTRSNTYIVSKKEILKRIYENIFI
jgi:hypothetical protein